jgi:ABC-type lipoprotein release transport system permease subunit
LYFAPDPAATYPILLNVGTDQETSLPVIWAAVKRVDPNLLPQLSLWNVEMMLVRPQRTLARVMAIFAAGLALLAVLMAGVGIYGVMTYVVSQRTQEIGIHMALGARSGDVLRSVVFWGLKPVATGMLIGLGCGAAVSALSHSTLSFVAASDYLYGVSFYDPLTFASITCFLASVSTLASLVPAIRAVTVDPIVALRYE